MNNLERKIKDEKIFILTSTYPLKTWRIFFAILSILWMEGFAK